MAHLQEVTVYKNRLMQAVCTNTAIQELLRVDGEDDMQGKDFVYERVFPYVHVPEVTEVGRAFICFDVIVPRVWSNITKQLEVDVYIMAHQDIMRLPEGRGIRIDLIAMEIDKILNGSTKYGLGEVELTYFGNFIPIKGYYGHEIRYKVTDINRNICEGD